MRLDEIQNNKTYFGGAYIDVVDHFDGIFEFRMIAKCTINVRSIERHQA